MGRPRTGLGTWGKIKVAGQIQNDNGRWVNAPKGVQAQRWRARTAVRDLDGVLRDVERNGHTKARAETALKTALRDRVQPRKGDLLRADMALVEAGKLWLRQVKRPETGHSENTIGQYEDGFKRYVEGSTIAGLTLREVNAVPIIRAYLQDVADERGSGSAKTAKSILSGILTMAVNDGVLEAHAARQVRPVKAAKPRPSRSDHRRALTRDERTELLEFVIADERANDRDIVDLLHWMAGMGMRISEALDQPWDDIELATVWDEDEGRDRVEGKAKIPGTKSTKSVGRIVTMPGWLAERMMQRKELHGIPVSGLAFASTRTGRRRDRRNTARQIRDVLDRAGFEWAVPHSFRRTVATDIDKAGLGASDAADVLGNDPQTVAKYYFGRRSDTSGAAAVL